jgi:mannose-6-phosphate isomerase-like protein (cupin superfamily)
MRVTTCGLVVGIACLHAGFVFAQTGQPGAVRRIVTGLDSAGKAVGLLDSTIAPEASPPRNPVGDLWVTTRAPAALSSTDRRGLATGIQPPPNGSVFRIVVFPPVTPEIEKQSLDTMMKVVGPSAPARGRPPKHPLMHRTRSVDYAIILSGEIVLMLDDSQVHLKAGDVVVQQATNHAWINRGKEPCHIAFVLLDAEEP